MSSIYHILRRNYNVILGIFVLNLEIFIFQARLLPLSVSSMTAGVHVHPRQASFYQPRAVPVLPSSQTMVMSNANSRIKRDTLSCDDIVDHCNNNADIDNSGSRNLDSTSLRRACNNPYAKVSLEKINCRNGFVACTSTPPPALPMTQSYHPHSIFYGQQYHRIQPFSASIATALVTQQQQPPLQCSQNGVPIRLTDSFEHLSVIQRHSGSSFRSSNTQSPPSVLMDDNCNKEPQENPYECIPAHFKQEAVTRFDINIDG